MPINDIDYFNQGQTGTTLTAEDSGYTSYINQPDKSSNVKISDDTLSGLNVSASIVSLAPGSSAKIADTTAIGAASSLVSEGLQSALNQVTSALSMESQAVESTTDLAKQTQAGETSIIMKTVLFGAAIIALVFFLPSIIAAFRGK